LGLANGCTGIWMLFYSANVAAITEPMVW
jgi:hypothetical protein